MYAYVCVLLLVCIADTFVVDNHLCAILLLIMCISIPTGQVFGEDYAKSPSLSQWGELVALSISVPLGSHPKICTCKD